MGWEHRAEGPSSARGRELEAAPWRKHRLECWWRSRHQQVGKVGETFQMKVRS